VLSKSVDIISKHPVIMLPQAVLIVPTLIIDVLNVPAFDPSRIVLGFVLFIFGVIVGGAYPSMVKSAISGTQPSVSEALGRAYHRFWSLLGAGILVGLIVVLGIIALVVPGVIFGTWYAYTVAAIMLEDKGALEGMAASKAFGRDKKWSTFLLFLVLVCAGIVILFIQLLVSFASAALGQVVYAILEVPLAAWIATALSYAYLACGPSSVPAATEVSVLGVPPPVSLQAAQTVASSINSAPAHFCPSCGSPVEAGSKFCRNCGRAL